MFTLDQSTEFGARVARRLRDESVIWLTTVREDGAPQPSPVWFLWDDRQLLIYSQPNTPKLRNIASNATVALNFDSDGQGGDIIVLSGQAKIDPSTPPATSRPAYIAKYRQGIAGIHMTPETFAATYSVAVLVTPTALRGH